MPPSGLTDLLTTPDGRPEVQRKVAGLMYYLADFTGSMHLVLLDAQSAPVVVQMDLR